MERDMDISIQDAYKNYLRLDGKKSIENFEKIFYLYREFYFSVLSNNVPDQSSLAHSILVRLITLPEYERLLEIVAFEDDEELAEDDEDYEEDSHYRRLCMEADASQYIQYQRLGGLDSFDEFGVKMLFWYNSFAAAQMGRCPYDFKKARKLAVGVVGYKNMDIYDEMHAEDVYDAVINGRNLEDARS